MPTPTIEWKKNSVKLIDQTLLPNKVKFVYCGSAESVWKSIRTMKIRGAPALGVAAAYGVYLGIRGSGKKNFFKNLDKTIKYLSTARPTARNLFWALERMKKAARKHMKTYSDPWGRNGEKIKRVLLR